MIKKYYLSLLLFFVFVTCAIATEVKPGDTGSITFRVTNSVQSLGNIESVQIGINCDHDGYFEITSSSGSQTILPGESYLFQIEYKISSTASEDFNVTLSINTITTNCLPELQTSEVLLPFTIDSDSPAPVTEFNAEWNNNNGYYSIKLTWINPGDTDLEGVMIYKNNPMDQGGQEIFNGLSQEYVDSDVNNIQYTYYAYTYDLAGNINNNYVYEIFLPDNNKPVVSNYSPISNLSENNPSFTATVIDNGTGVDIPTLGIWINGYVYRNVSFDENTNILSFNFSDDYELSDGKYIWKIIGRDNAGNEINDFDHNLILDVTPPRSRVYGH